MARAWQELIVLEPGRHYEHPYLNEKDTVTLTELCTYAAQKLHLSLPLDVGKAQMNYLLSMYDLDDLFYMVDRAASAQKTDVAEIRIFFDIQRYLGEARFLQQDKRRIRSLATSTLSLLGGMVQ